MLKYEAMNILKVIKRYKKNILLFLGLELVILALTLPYVFFIQTNKKAEKSVSQLSSKTMTLQPTPINNEKIELETPPSSKILSNGIQIFQSFNNCGPASLSMALSYFGINKSQKELGDDLRPYQIPGGDNDDKSVTLEELAQKAEELGLTPFHRPNGNPEIIKLFIAYDIPVIARTWTKANEDIGHYRVIKGYDSTGFIQDDSLQGKDLHYSYSDFDLIWKKFNYEYLALVPENKLDIAKAILSDDVNFQKAWTRAAENAKKELEVNQNDIYARFNLSVALYNIGDFKNSVVEFEKIETSLPFRTLWYQIEPIVAYYELGDYARVFSITDKILANQNRAFSELYIIRGNIYLNQGNTNQAREEFEKAVFYNTNLKEAKDALLRLS